MVKLPASTFINSMAIPFFKWIVSEFGLVEALVEGTGLEITLLGIEEDVASVTVVVVELVLSFDREITWRGSF